MLGVQDVISLGVLNLADIRHPPGSIRRRARGNTRRAGAGAPHRHAPAHGAGGENLRQSLPNEGQTERALALLGLALRQPSWAGEDQQELEVFLSRWALDRAVVDAGLAKGAALDWDLTIQTLLKG